MTFLKHIGLAALFVVAVTLTLLSRHSASSASARTEGLRSTVPIALSVPVEVIEVGQDPSVRQIMVLP
ncbi:hypothetical protein [Haloferula helveola]|uniref:hypothetical protein n=1 Tax=Haloferula helveola TaxID=490095 RepID=UPI0030CA9845